jgi:hypothetical protein
MQSGINKGVPSRICHNLPTPERVAGSFASNVAICGGNPGTDKVERVSRNVETTLETAGLAARATPAGRTARNAG